MRRPGRGLLGALVLGAFLAPASTGRAEDLNQAWALALQVNSRLLAQQDDSRGAASNVAAARSARLPSIKNQSFDAMLTPQPAFSLGGLGRGRRRGGAGLATLGAGQSNIPLTNTAVVDPDL